MKIGYLVDSWEEKGYPWLYTFERFADSLKSHPNHEVEVIRDLEKVNDYEFAVIPQTRTENESGWYEEWARGNLDVEVETPFAHHIMDGRSFYNGRIQRGVIDRANAIWCAAEYVDPFDKPVYWTPFGAWDEDYDVEEKDDIIRTAVSRIHEPECEGVRIAALMQCPLEMEVWGGMHRGDEYENNVIDFPNTLEYKGYAEGNDIYRRSKFLFEPMSQRWLVPKKDPGDYWSDRISYALSFGCHLITNYEPELREMESTISYQKAYSEWEEHGTLAHLYDHEAIKRDREWWHMNEIMHNALDKTLESLEYREEL